MIAEALLPLAVPVDDLTLFEANPRRGNVEAIARSLDAFGQRKPLVATRDGVVVAGNHTLQAARELGWDKVAVVWVDDDPTTANAYALADNRTAELGHFDPTALAELIAAVQAEDEALLEAISYDAADLDDLLAGLQESAETLVEHSVPDTPYGSKGTGEGSFVEPSFGERYDDYQAKAVRSFVLDYPLEAYERLAGKLAELRDSWGLASTAEVVAELVERATA